MILFTILIAPMLMAVLASTDNEDICNCLAQNKSIEFFAMGFNKPNLLMITSNLLVYDLPLTILQQTPPYKLNLDEAQPVPLKNKWPKLYNNSDFVQIQSKPTLTFTTKDAQGKQHYLVMYSKMYNKSLLYQFGSGNVTTFKLSYPVDMSQALIDKFEPSNETILGWHNNLTKTSLSELKFDPLDGGKLVKNGIEMQLCPHNISHIRVATASGAQRCNGTLHWTVQNGWQVNGTLYLFGKQLHIISKSPGHFWPFVTMSHRNFFECPEPRPITTNSGTTETTRISNTTVTISSTSHWTKHTTSNTTTEKSITMFIIIAASVAGLFIIFTILCSLCCGGDGDDSKQISTNCKKLSKKPVVAANAPSKDSVSNKHLPTNKSKQQQMGIQTPKMAEKCSMSQISQASQCSASVKQAISSSLSFKQSSTATPKTNIVLSAPPPVSGASNILPPKDAPSISTNLTNAKSFGIPVVTSVDLTPSYVANSKKQPFPTKH